ncbi:TonB-dependent siderophore receptor [Symbiopectobacterium purcellii]|uniref:TonB-dependent siderophore receptor n=1 Tax=Symbiopectobacterium purcellii TaxID=2871826 RepID=A0ABX9AIQ1_9ENTR|nr:TonB-dependent siderophore receptor [Symbiopectobacterium purcellii]QZN95053.1 TonB-dependent siderophore receptor [Symbiopectobacterium purcellii]
MKKRFSRHTLATLIGDSCGAASLLVSAQAATPTEVEQNSGDTMVVTAAEQTRQAPGVSVITREDIQRRPPANDLSEIIRTMPGVNLTGNSNSGSRGNNRQIDIRGMGPENTLILIDGKPVSSRSSVRYGWRGERDTRGDTNWVPSNMVERIEVLRGPAAARYGNGAAGGVVNIITKQPTDEWHGAWNSYMNFPEHKSEGATKRTDFNLMGGLTDTLSMRLYGNYSKTQADAWDINNGHQLSPKAAIPAGREGVRNKDINGLLRWEFMPQQTLEFEMGASRQGNIYAGDSENNNGNAQNQALFGQETNRMYRQKYALTHRGYWDSGVSALSYFQYERTDNSRIFEPLAGGPAGRPTGGYYTDITLDAYAAHSEVNIPFELLFNQTATIGAEWVEQKMHDPSSNTQTTDEGGSIGTIADINRSQDISARIASVFVEDNIEVTDSTMLTPALRLDHHSIVGTNWSPSLNLSQQLGEDFTLKMGIARAYKAPNLYQLNPNYLLYSRGNGCNGDHSFYLMGRDDLKAETSVNKEIGLEFKRNGYQAGVTYFRNDYRNKIESGVTKLGTAVGGSTTGSTAKYANANIFQWENVPKALVEGLEGSLTVPVTETISWNNNITWMLRLENKTTGEYLSITPEFTLNSSVSWQATDDLSFLGKMTWYGRQKPKKYNYQGTPVASIPLTAAYDTNEVSPYAVFGLSSTYKVNKNLSITGGVDNLLDKRQFRKGNAQSLTSTNDTTGITSISTYGAGAATFNEPGRTFYVSVNTSF